LNNETLLGKDKDNRDLGRNANPFNSLLNIRKIVKTACFSLHKDIQLHYVETAENTRYLNHLSETHFRILPLYILK